MSTITPQLVRALERQGFAIVPMQMTAAQKGRRYMTLDKPPEDRYAAVVAEGRVRA